MAPDLRLCFATSLGVRKVTYQDMIQHKRRECEGTDRAIRHAFAGHPGHPGIRCTMYADQAAPLEPGEERTKGDSTAQRHGIRHAFAMTCNATT